MKTKKLLVAMALALGLPAGAQAAISFDPDGAGPLGAIDMAAMDWTQTSMLAINGTTAIENCLNGSCSSPESQFDLLLQSTLVATSDSSSQINTPTGLNETFEITMVARFTETVTAIFTQPNSVTAFFETVASAGGYLEFYFDTTPDSDPLTGSGYSDGRLILLATDIGTSTGSFTITTLNGVPVLSTLDLANDDDYGSGEQLTVTGSGNNGNIDVSNVTSDPTFFLADPSTISLNFNNISQGLPFIQVDPSDCFTDNQSGVGVGNISAGECAFVHTDGAYAVQGADGQGGYVPNILGVNGLTPVQGGGPDEVFQTDFNTAINGQTVPEPGSLALLGLGLGLAALVGRRRPDPLGV